MLNTAKRLFAISFLVIVAMVVALLMRSTATGIEGAGGDFQGLAIKMAICRVVVLGFSMLFAWEFIAKKFYGFFRVDISLVQFRVLGWYLAAEAVVIGSLYGL